MRSLLLVIAMGCCGVAHAQHVVDVDSLQGVLKTSADPLARLEAMVWLSRAPDNRVSSRYAPAVIRLADSLLAHGHANDPDILGKKAIGLWNTGTKRYQEQGMPDSAVVFWQQAAGIWAGLGNEDRVAFANSGLGVHFYHAGDLGQARSLFERALRSHELLHDTASVAEDLYKLASCANSAGDLASAIDQLTRAIALLATGTPSDHSKGMEAMALSEMGGIYGALEQPDSAIAYYRRASDLYNEVMKPAKAGLMSLNWAAEALEMGDTATYRSVLSSALNMIDPEGDPDIVSAGYSFLSERCLMDGRNDSALFWARKAMDLAQRSGFTTRQITSGLMMAQALTAMHRIPEALRVIESLPGMDAADQAWLKDRRDIARLLSEIYAIAGPPEKALEAYKQFRMLDDSLRSEAGRRKLHYLDLRKQQEAESLQAREQRRQLVQEHEEQLNGEVLRKRMALIGGIGVLVLAVVLWRLLGRTRREKARSEEILHNVLPEEVAREIRETGTAKSREIDQVSILFTDFKGFTELSATLPRQELMAEIDACFKVFDGISHRHGVEKIKTIGDAYMAAAGLNGVAHDAAVCTVRAALEMQAFIEARYAERSAQGLPAFRMRVGIHTGPVVAGIVGVKKFQYDIWGDTVNTASRMESSSEVGQVNISEATYELVKNEPGLTFTSRGKVQAKGKGEMEMYFVERA